jgi:hypothetical protein
MKRWSSMKFDPMQYQGVPAASALDRSLPASELAQHGAWARARAPAWSPLRRRSMRLGPRSRR